MSESEFKVELINQGDDDVLSAYGFVSKSQITALKLNKIRLKGYTSSCGPSKITLHSESNRYRTPVVIEALAPSPRVQSSVAELVALSKKCYQHGEFDAEIFKRALLAKVEK